MADQCNSFIGDPAVAMVVGGYNNFVGLANGTYQLIVDQTQVLGNLDFAPVDYTAQWGFNDAGGSFQRPERPNLPSAALEFDPAALEGITEPPEFDARNVDLDTIPDFTAQAPTLSFPSAPQPLSTLPPGPAPAVPNRTAPEEPDYVLPAVPDLETILVPLPPDISLPDFDGIRPTVNLPELIENWSFTPGQYESDLLDQVKARLSTMLAGGTGLPEAVRDALWQQARDRVDVEIARAEQETIEDFAVRGFTEPTGALAKRMQQVRQAGQNQRSETARTLTIEDARLEQANLQFAVTQGIALEGVLVSLFVQQQQLLLATANFRLDSSIRVFEAQASVIRLQFEIYKADAEVFESRIRGELAKAEVYKAEVEAAKVRGEINEQLVRRYLAQIEAVKAMADFYNSRIQGFKAQVDADVSRVQAYAEQVRGYEALVRAKEGEFRSYGIGVDAQQSRAATYETLSRAFAARVQGVVSKNQGSTDLERLRIQQHEATLRAWGGGLDIVRLRLGAERDRVGAVAQAFDARARIYASEAQVETAASAQQDRRVQLGIERERARTDVALKNAEISVQQNIQLLSLELDKQKSIAQVLAQIGASAMNAVSFGASVSSGRNESKGCSTNYNYNGEIAT
jgi:hypothetical protein